MANFSRSSEIAAFQKASSLDEFLQGRRELANAGFRLSDWVVQGYYLIRGDSVCTITIAFNGGRALPPIEFPELAIPQLILFEELIRRMASKGCSSYSYDTSPATYPKKGDYCHYCGEGWNFNQIADFVSDEKNTPAIYHTGFFAKISSKNSI
jgi:hypothetical protein